MSTAFNSFDASALGARVQSAVDGNAFNADGTGGAAGTLYLDNDPDLTTWDPVTETAGNLAGPDPDFSFSAAVLVGGEPWLAGRFDDGVTDERRVYKYTGGAWSQVGDVSSYTRTMGLADVSGTAYLYVRPTNASSNDGEMLTSTGGAWSVLSTGIGEIVAIRGVGGVLYGTRDVGSTLENLTWDGSDWVTIDWSGIPSSAMSAGDFEDGHYAVGRVQGVPGLVTSSNGVDGWSVVDRDTTHSGISADVAVLPMRVAALAGKQYFWSHVENVSTRARLARGDGASVTFSLGARTRSPVYEVAAHGGKLYTIAILDRNQVRTASIDTLDATPANNTFRVTTGGQFEEQVGDTDVATTAAALVATLNASAQANIAKFTWSNPAGGSIVGTVDEPGDSITATLSVSGAGSGTVTNFALTTSHLQGGLKRWNTATEEWDVLVDSLSGSAFLR